ncbi:MAG: hypothetical protein QGG40_07175, partial [Myxococcota bacterium]|nr:hypothetical protein [Myxococcota bacterium]
MSPDTVRLGDLLPESRSSAVQLNEPSDHTDTLQSAREVARATLLDVLDLDEVPNSDSIAMEANRSVTQEASTAVEDVGTSGSLASELPGSDLIMTDGFGLPATNTTPVPPDETEAGIDEVVVSTTDARGLEPEVAEPTEKPSRVRRGRKGRRRRVERGPRQAPRIKAKTPDASRAQTTPEPGDATVAALPASETHGVLRLEEALPLTLPDPVSRPEASPEIDSGPSERDIADTSVPGIPDLDEVPGSDTTAMEADSSINQEPSTVVENVGVSGSPTSKLPGTESVLTDGSGFSAPNSDAVLSGETEVGIDETVVSTTDSRSPESEAAEPAEKRSRVRRGRKGRRRRAPRAPRATTPRTQAKAPGTSRTDQIKPEPMDPTAATRPASATPGVPGSEAPVAVTSPTVVDLAVSSVKTDPAGRVREIPLTSNLELSEATGALESNSQVRGVVPVVLEPEETVVPVLEAETPKLQVDESSETPPRVRRGRKGQRRRVRRGMPKTAPRTRAAPTTPAPVGVAGGISTTDVPDVSVEFESASIAKGAGPVDKENIEPDSSRVPKVDGSESAVLVAETGNET